MNQAIAIGCGNSGGFVLHPRNRVHTFDEAISHPEKLALLEVNKGESMI